jgi:hypothetical protein
MVTEFTKDLLGLVISLDGRYSLAGRTGISDPLKILPISAHNFIIGCFIVMNIV